MPTAGTLRVGQVAPNTYWVTVSQGGSLAAFDFTTVSAASIVVKKPSGATQTWTTVLSAQTTTGLTATHSLVLGDVDEAGTYTGYLLMTVSGGTIRSESSQFYVAEEFAEVDSNEVPGWIIAGAIISGGGGGGGAPPGGNGVALVSGGAWLGGVAGPVNLASGTYVSGTLGVGNGGTGITSIASGMAAFWGAPSSANLAATLTDETGTGEVVFSTSPTFKTGILLNNPANTFAYTFTPAAIAAARTITLPLLTGNDTMVTEAFTQTLTNKTINGSSNTITNVAISTAVSGLGAGVATFLGTPSSANLATAVTDETGSGSLVFGTAPTFKTTLTLRNPADTFSYIFTPAAIAANRTLTLPLLTSNDTMVTEAFTQTLTNKTISGASNTITNVPISTGISGLGANVATWLATPSSANLAAAVTDETGTGSLMFGTAPTVKTTLTIRNPADTFSYTITPAAIAATRVLNLPLLTGNDTLVAEAHTQTLTNKTISASSNTITNIVNANVNAAAAIAGTKISPDFGSQLVQTAGDALATNILATGYFHTSGSPSPTTGQIRLENTHKIVTRNAGNTANMCIAQGSSGDFVYYGLNSSYTEQAYGVVLGATNFVWLAVNSAFYIKLESSEVRMINPVVGDVSGYASPYGCHGAVVSAMTDADYTVPDSEYKYYTIQFTCVGATTRTVTFPHPSSLARSYTKNIIGSTEQILTISTGTGTTVNLGVNKSRIFEFTNGGVRAIGPEY